MARSEQRKQPRKAPAKEPRRNAFYAQSGGVTAVINATACGVIETARRHGDRIGKVFAGRNGNNQFINYCQFNVYCLLSNHSF